MSSYTNAWDASGKNAPGPIVFDSRNESLADFDPFGWDNNRNQEPDEFSTAIQSAAEANKWIIAAGIASAVVSTIAIVVIVYAIINCLSKAGYGRSGYARLEMGQSIDSISSPSTSKLVSKVTNNQALITKLPPAFDVILNSQLEAATVERFLRDIAMEKPIRFSTSQLSEFTQDYSTVLGSGGFGEVYRGELPNGVPLAIKVLTGNLGKQVEEQFMAEIRTIGRTYHINLVRLYGFCFDPTKQALVYEFMENGSLDRFLFGENRAVVEWEKLYEIAIGTAKGIAYLHEECQQRIIHYDIKPGNVLLDSKLCPKVADFGLAKLCNRDSTHVTMSNYRGTPGYAAPEIYMPFPVTHKCDVYSFGMLLFEIVGRRRNHNPNLSESQEWLPRWTWEKFEQGELKELMEICGIEEEEDKGQAERLCLVALWCVQYSPDARPLMSTVVKMLEGGVEIVPPPNPFQYLISACLGSTSSSTGSNGDSNSSTSRSEPTEKPSSTSSHSPIKGTLEIELAN
ncbi:rust resistance kinase Lr10-like [Macadamia integrifolia]|uniref:rust resistance kinase Lr10-like n=1 Tax=Macadamia integrifolia TaxID=60698 RepID=UPI001C52EF3B|nr:rust resistance kinase Lr10-like [Macadamia integrifolia]